jgi:hypothetical protein
MADALDEMRGSHPDDWPVRLESRRSRFPGHEEMPGMKVEKVENVAKVEKKGSRDG